VFLGAEFLGTERPFSEPAGNSFFGMRSTFTETGLGRLSLTESQPVRDTSLGIKNVGGVPKNYPAHQDLLTPSHVLSKQFKESCLSFMRCFFPYRKHLVSLSENSLLNLKTTQQLQPFDTLARFPVS